MRRMLIPFFIIFGSVFAFIHVIAVELYLYWRYPWMDWPMHFYGGIVVVLGIFSLAQAGIFVREEWLNFWTVIGTLFVIAVGWEVYEVLIGTLRESNYILDTSVDLLLGLAGGACGYYLASRFYHSKY